jgi:N-succinyldiaminopimelate aminotransferase
MNPQFANLPVSIFEHMSGLARDHCALNLGQGFPDFGWPEDVIDAAAKALALGSNQYPPMRGLPELRQAICDHYRAHQSLEVAPEQVTVTSGATEALAAAIMALVTPGDEVVLFQPLYDAYLPLVRRCGGVPRLARLDPPGWRLDDEVLAQAFTPRTRLVIFNNPHNPTARLFDEEELQALAGACVRHDAIALVDEVWEHVAFDGRRHVPLAAMPGMAERTVKVGSAGKIFSMTGWKVGWVIAPEATARPIAGAHQYLAFTTPPNLQAAVAYGLGKDASWFDEMRSGFAAARDYLRHGLEAAGFVPLASEATYFMCVDLPASGIAVDDVTFCERAVREAGVAAIPLSSFFDENPEGRIIRLCFAKKEETLAKGIEQMALARRLFRE